MFGNQKSLKKKVIEDKVDVELSSNKLTPGLLKIFGEHVSQGSNYKAVRVSTLSTAQEVVLEALEKYGLDHCNPKEYILCDVIGQFTTSGTGTTENIDKPNIDKPKKKSRSKKRPSQRYDDDNNNNTTTTTTTTTTTNYNNNNDDDEKPVWKTEYVRAINDIEKPLILQSLWKPKNGKLRRFELRNKVELENSYFILNTQNSENGVRDSFSEISSRGGSDLSNDVSSYGPTMSIKTYSSSEISPQGTENKHLKRRKDEIDPNLAPQFGAYILMIKGCSNNDKLVHKLQDPTIIVGPYMESEMKQCDIVLYSSDVLLPHCWLYKKIKIDGNPSETTFDELQYLIFIEPANGAAITIGGKSITTTTLLRPGDLITFGKDYLFLFKDPTEVKDCNMIFPRIDVTSIPSAQDSNLLQLPTVNKQEPEYATVMLKTTKDTKDQAIQVGREYNSASENEVSEESEVSLEGDGSKQESIPEPRKLVEKSNLQLTYNLRQEDDLLHSIIDIADEDSNFKLMTAYFFIMAIEHSAANFSEIQTRKLLLKISSGMQGIAWEKTKEIGKETSEKSEDAMSLHNRILPKLKPVLYWLANALQMLHFLQCNLKKYLLSREEVRSSQNAVLTADEELLSVLEEVIMFTFQQIVYHLTKVLYGALPAILEVNPFSAEHDDNDDDDDEQKPPHPMISRITQILSDIFIAAENHHVHPQIISQIFAYLFFFCNASLFNSLMEKGPISKVFRWKKGVQIRDNLDVLEEWAQANGLSKEFDEYFGKFVAAITLLSTPKVHLMQCEWNQLRDDYPLLNPAQLQLLLGEYQLNGKQKPRGWYPCTEEVESALKTSEVLESFATHPPLMLPSTKFVLDLNEHPKYDDFSKNLKIIHDKFGKDQHYVKEDEIHAEVQSNFEMSSPLLTAIENNQDNDKTSIQVEDNDANENTHDPSDYSPPSEVVFFDSTGDTPSAETGSVSNIEDQEKIMMPPKSSIDYDENFEGDIENIQKKRDQSITSNVENVEDNKIIILDNDVELQANTERTNVVPDSDVNGLNFQAKDEGGINYTNANGHVQNGNDNVIVVELKRHNKVLGLGLIDGKFTPLKNNGVYIRTIIPNTPAAAETRLRVGDRILAVNGSNVLDKDYPYAMGLIKESGESISLLISTSDEETVNQILSVA